MNESRLSDTVAVSPQISVADVPGIAAAGYKVLINNRPDGEAADQPTSAEIEAAALAAGLEYHHMPVTMMDFPGPDFDAMSDLLDDEDRPVFAFCRTGTRCANLWVSSRDADAQDAAAARASGSGFELGMANKYLGRG
ncbi:MAG: TIGR01244 family phosphatase [Halioglobus sp.]|nr:TIGR01244 family phosphatase [Halioglobus sp.]